MMDSLPTPGCTQVQPLTRGKDGKLRKPRQTEVGVPRASGHLELTIRRGQEALSPQCFTDPTSQATLPGDQSQLMASILRHECV